MQKEAAEKKYDVAIEELMHDERVAERKATEQQEKATQYQLHTVRHSMIREYYHYIRSFSVTSHLVTV